MTISSGKQIRYTQTDWVRSTCTHAAYNVNSLHYISLEIASIYLADHLVLYSFHVNPFAGAGAILRPTGSDLLISITMF